MKVTAVVVENIQLVINCIVALSLDGKEEKRSVTQALLQSYIVLCAGHGHLSLFVQSKIMSQCKTLENF